MDYIKQKEITIFILGILMFFYGALLPFENVLSFSFGSMHRMISFCIVFICLAVLASSKKMIIQKNCLLLLLWLLICVISILWVKSFAWWSYFIRIYIWQVVVFILLIALPKEYASFDYMKKGLLAGAIIAATVLLIFPVQTSFTAEGRRTIVLLGTKMDPNILGAIIIIAIFVLLDYSFKKTGIEKKLMLVFGLPVLLYGLFITGSRGATIALLLSVSIMFFMLLIRTKRKRSAIATLVFGVVLSLVLYMVLPEDLLVARYSGNTLFGLNEFSSGAHNRYTIWLHSWNLFLNKPLFGYGCGNFFYAIDTVYKECAAHNIVVLSVVEMGVVGSMPIFLFILDIIKGVFRSNNIFISSMMIAILTVSLSLDSLPYKYFWIALIIGVYTRREDIQRE